MLVVTSAHLCFLPWALGAMHGWSQVSSLILAAAGLVLALIRRGSAKPSPPNASRMIGPLDRLMRWPVFWAGLAGLSYVALQGFNPAWRYVSNTDHWWLEPLPHLAWLPAGIEAPFARSNPWRMLLILGTLLLLASSVWIGFSRRKTYRIFLTLLAGNAALLALLGLGQRLDGTSRIFWTHLPSNSRFIASFIYPNHAGPYFYLMTALASGLAWWSCRQAGRGRLSPVWRWLFTFIAVLTGSLVIHTNSRMSVLMLAAFALLMAAVAGLVVLRRKAVPGRPAVSRSTLLIVVLASLVGAGLTVLPARKVWTRFSESADQHTATGLDRQLARQAATDMLKERWLFGWGAGCFRHGFPLFVQKYPAIYQSAGGRIRYWEHAHSDLLEIPLELGVVGMLPVLFCLAWLAGGLIRHRCWRNRVSLPLVFGCALLLVHAWVDFVFQNPAVLFTWTILLIAAIRWSELDQPAPVPAAAGSRPRD